MADTIRWEQTACPLCGSHDADEFLRAPGDNDIEYRLAQCRHCALVYTNPRPEAACIGQFYPADYAPYQPRELHKNWKLRTLWKHFFGRNERTLADRIPVPPGGKLLDYGCGSGRFAAKMRERGWNAIGMDFSSHAAESARRNFGLTVIHGDLPHPEVSAGSFDAVTMREVLEHLHNPVAALRAAFAALKPNGSLYVSVPNLAGWSFRRFGRAWSALDLPRHLTHFTPETLRQTVTSAGFVVDAVKTREHVKWIANSAKRAGRLNPRWWTKAARLRFIQGALASWTVWRGQAESLCLLAHKPAVATREPVRRAA